MQTSTMIKATARSAPDREREINNLIRKADFNNDPFVQEFGLNISHNLMEVRNHSPIWGGSQNTFAFHPSVEKDLCLKIEVRDQTIWKSTHEL